MTARRPDHGFQRVGLFGNAVSVRPDRRSSTRLARHRGGTIAWYLPDRLGTVRDLINNSGASSTMSISARFGTVLGQSSPTSGDRLWASRDGAGYGHGAELGGGAGGESGDGEVG